MKAYDFIDQNIGKRVYINGVGDLGFDGNLRKYIYIYSFSMDLETYPVIIINKRTRGGLAYLETGGNFISVPISNVRLFSELEKIRDKNESIQNINLTKDIIKHLDNFYGYSIGDVDCYIRDSISDINAIMRSNKIEINITTKNPELIIGGSGDRMKKLQDYIGSKYQRFDLLINIIKNKLEWNANIEY